MPSLIRTPTEINSSSSSGSRARTRDREPQVGEEVCPVCGASLIGRRCDALYCGGPCRAEASRVRRLRDGGSVDGYGDLTAYNARQRRTKLGGVAS